ncbi:MAG: peptidase BlaR1, partial [Gemmatimonadetes bacterium]|nr:peptidase BlaR1 [Gemmatimonadota bacterium]
MSAVLPFAAASLLAKATLLFALAAAAGFLLRGAAAAARHMAWTLALGAALMLPLLSITIPGWKLPVLPASADGPTPAPLAAAASSASPDQVPVVASVRASSGASTTATRGSAVNVSATIEPPSAWTASASTESAPTGSPSTASTLALGWPRVLLVLWMLGAAAVLARMAAGAWALRRIERASLPPADAAWDGLLRDLRWMMDVRRPVRLITGTGAAMPMTWGTRRPVILLPAGADGWAEERRRIVLLHELAHVARHDCLTQWMAGVACAMYWFHPGAWHAARRMRVERERACDDRVLAAGTRGPVYAAHLLEVARAFRTPGLAAAMSVPMARASQLEGRLLAVLDGARRRPALSRRAAAAASAAALALVVPLAALRPVPARASTPSWKAEAGSESSSTAPSVDGRTAAHPAVDVTGTAFGAPAAGQQDRVVEKTLPARPGGRLTLELEPGGGVSVTSWDRDEVWMRATIGGRDGRWTEVRMEPARDGVRVAARQTAHGGSVSTSSEYSFRVPRRYSVQLSSAGGGVMLAGLEGTFRGRTGGGPMTLAGLRGTVDLVTGGGRVRVSDSQLDGTVRTGGGGVVLERNHGRLRGWSGSESVAAPAAAEAAAAAGGAWSASSVREDL